MCYSKQLHEISSHPVAAYLGFLSHHHHLLKASGHQHHHSSMVQDHLKQMTHLLKHHQVSSLMLYHKAYVIQLTSHHRHFHVTTFQEEGWVQYNKIFWERRKKKKRGHIIAFITIYFMISCCCSSVSVPNLSIKLYHRYVYRGKNMVYIYASVLSVVSGINWVSCNVSPRQIRGDCCICKY